MSFYEELKALTENSNKTPKDIVLCAEQPIVPIQKTSTTPMLDIDEITADDIPLEFVKKYLRVEHDLDDIEIQVAILSAQKYVRNYIKQPPEEPLDYELIIPILTLVAHFYENKSPQMKSTEKLDTLFGTMLDLHRREIV